MPHKTHYTAPQAMGSLFRSQMYFYYTRISLYHNSYVYSEFYILK